MQQSTPITIQYRRGGRTAGAPATMDLADLLRTQTACVAESLSPGIQDFDVSIDVPELGIHERFTQHMAPATIGDMLLQAIEASTTTRAGGPTEGVPPAHGSVEDHIARLEGKTVSVGVSHAPKGA